MAYLENGSKSYSDESKDFLHIQGMGDMNERIKTARQRAKLTQYQLGMYCAVSRNAVTQWEATDPKKRTNPSFDNLSRIAAATHVNIQWLLTGEDADATRKPLSVAEYPSKYNDPAGLESVDPSITHIVKRIDDMAQSGILTKDKIDLLVGFLDFLCFFKSKHS